MIQIRGRGDVVEAKTIIECKSPARTPVVLDVPFCRPKEIASNGPLVGFLVIIEVANERIGETVTGISRVVAVVVEAISSALRNRGGLKLVVTLHIDTGLELMFPPYLAQVIHEHVGRIRQSFRKLLGQTGVHGVSGRSSEADSGQPVRLSYRVLEELGRVAHPRPQDERGILWLDIHAVESLACG